MDSACPERAAAEQAIETLRFRGARFELGLGGPDRAAAEQAIETSIRAFCTMLAIVGPDRAAAEQAIETSLGGLDG